MSTSHGTLNDLNVAYTEALESAIADAQSMPITEDDVYELACSLEAGSVNPDRIKLAKAKPQPSSSTRLPLSSQVCIKSASFCADGQIKPNKGHVADEMPAAKARPKGSLNCCLSSKERICKSAPPPTPTL